MAEAQGGGSRLQSRPSPSHNKGRFPGGPKSPSALARSAVTGPARFTASSEKKGRAITHQILVGEASGIPRTTASLLKGYLAEKGKGAAETGLKVLAQGAEKTVKFPRKLLEGIDRRYQNRKATRENNDLIARNEREFRGIFREIAGRRGDEEGITSEEIRKSATIELKRVLAEKAVENEQGIQAENAADQSKRQQLEMKVKNNPNFKTWLDEAKNAYNAKLPVEEQVVIPTGSAIEADLIKGVIGEQGAKLEVAEKAEAARAERQGIIDANKDKYNGFLAQRVKDFARNSGGKPITAEDADQLRNSAFDDLQESLKTENEIKTIADTEIRKNPHYAEKLAELIVTGESVEEADKQALEFAKRGMLEEKQTSIPANNWTPEENRELNALQEKLNNHESLTGDQKKRYDELQGKVKNALIGQKEKPPANPNEALAQLMVGSAKTPEERAALEISVKKAKENAEAKGESTSLFQAILAVLTAVALGVGEGA